MSKNVVRNNLVKRIVQKIEHDCNLFLYMNFFLIVIQIFGLGFGFGHFQQKKNSFGLSLGFGQSRNFRPRRISSLLKNLKFGKLCSYLVSVAAMTQFAVVHLFHIFKK